MPSLAEPIVPDGRLRALEQPTLAVDGLLVRPWQLVDASAVFDAYQDPAIQHWHVRSMADLRAPFARLLKNSASGLRSPPRNP